MPWYPKAIRKEITKHRTPMAAYRRLILHTAVSSSASLFSWHQKVSHCSHFYLRHDGVWEQYVDTRLRAPNQQDGNADSISVESQDMGGPFPSWSGSNVPAWTAKQVEAIAELAVWLNTTHGIPLVQLPSSKPGTRGIGWHRQGIDGNFPGGILAGRVSGGETWSGPGKVCPGDRRIKQVPAIVARAKQIVEGDDMPIDKADVNRLWNMDNVVRAPDGYSDANPFWSPSSIIRSAQMYARTGRAVGEQVRSRVDELLAGQAAIAAKLGGEDPGPVVRAELERHRGLQRAERQADLAAFGDSLGPALAEELRTAAADLPAEAAEAVAGIVDGAVERALGRTTFTVAPADEEG